jgi:hypothetical protein
MEAGRTLVSPAALTSRVDHTPLAFLPRIVCHGRQRLENVPLVHPFWYLLITISVERHIILGPRISMNSLDTNLKYIKLAESKKLGFHPWVKPRTYLWRCDIFLDGQFVDCMWSYHSIKTCVSSFPPRTGHTGGLSYLGFVIVARRLLKVRIIDQPIHTDR